MTDLRLLDLFSGIGGFSYAAERLVGGYETVGFCEIDPFCRQILNKHWPDVEVFEDVRRTDDFIRCGRVDIITGGYPCQPFSTAGKQKGAEDDRHLWPAMFELVKQKRPSWVIGENVAGHIGLGLDQVLFDLESEGYTARPFVIPACAVDAPHKRDRVWVVAHANSKGEPDVTRHAEAGQRLGSEDVGDPSGGRLSGDDRWRSGQESADGRAHVADTASGRSQEHGHGGAEDAVQRGEALADANSSQREGRSISSGIHSQHTQPDGGGKLFGDRLLADADRDRRQQMSDRESGKGGGVGPQIFEQERNPNSAQKAHVFDANSVGLEGGAARQISGLGKESRQSVRAGQNEPQFWATEPNVGRVAHGIPRRVDRLKSLGNSIVPQVAAQILRAIREAHDA